MIENLLKDTRSKMEKVVDFFSQELIKFHIGRVNPAILEDVEVSCYDGVMPLKQLATISAPETKVLIINPWDKSVIENIEAAVRKSDFNFSCSNDGEVIRITIPSLTEERRKELIRLVKKKAEEARIAIRNSRREVLEKIELAKANSEISEDDFYRSKNKLDDITSQFNKQIDQLLLEKEKELSEV